MRNFLTKAEYNLFDLLAVAVMTGNFAYGNILAGFVFASAIYVVGVLLKGTK